MARQRLWVGPFTQLFCLSSIVDHSLLIVSPKFIIFVCLLFCLSLLMQNLYQALWCELQPIRSPSIQIHYEKLQTHGSSQ